MTHISKDREPRWPDPTKGEFTHRINQVPDLGRRIVFHDTTGVERGALVVKPIGPNPIYRGTGDDVRLQTADGRLFLPSAFMVDWRYAE